MADRLEIAPVWIRQRGEAGCEALIRLYRLGDPVTDADGNVTYPRTLLRTVTWSGGPVHPFGRFRELFRDRLEAWREEHPILAAFAETVD